MDTLVFLQRYDLIHNVTEILLRLAVNTYNPNPNNVACDFRLRNKLQFKERTKKQETGSFLQKPNFTLLMISDVVDLLTFVSDCYLMPIQQFFSYIMARTS